MMLGIGLVALVVVIVGVVIAIGMAGRQETEEAARSGARSEPGDFVAPISSGGHAWRNVDETADQFKERVARENAAIDGKKG